jgi:transposase
MTKRFRDCNLDQLVLLPPCLQDWLPENHLARFIADVMKELDPSALYAEYEGDGRGLAAYDPLMMTRLLLYGYSIGVTSSRRIERATYDDVAFRYLAANQHPDHDTIADFRRQHLKALAEMFKEAVRLCQQAGLVKLGNVAIDGTKILANASTRRSLPYKKLQEREKYWEKIVADLLAAAQQTDEQEDQRYGKGEPADPLPPELANAQSRLERIRQAKATLEQEAQQHLEELQRIAQAQKQGRAFQKEQSAADRERRRDRTKKQLKRARRNADSPSRQHNFVDPDSRVMMDTARKCYVQAYNAQAAADSHAQVIVAAEVTQQVNDKQQLVPMTKAVQENTGSNPDVITADCGYWDTNSLLDPVMQGIEVLVAPDSQPPGAPLPGNAPNNAEAKRMREVLDSDSGKTKYQLRKAVIEPVFGQIKEARGIRRFRLRGLEKVAREWKLICGTHNLLKLYRHRNPLPKPKMARRGSRKQTGPKVGFCNHQRVPLTIISLHRRLRCSGLIVGAARLPQTDALSPTGSQADPALPRSFLLQHAVVERQHRIHADQRWAHTYLCRHSQWRGLLLGRQFQRATGRRYHDVFDDADHGIGNGGPDIRLDFRGR